MIVEMPVTAIARTGLVSKMAERLSSPWLVVLLAAATLLDISVIDPLPLVDEVVLGTSAVLLARWQKRRRARLRREHEPPQADAAPAEAAAAAEPAATPGAR